MMENVAWECVLDAKAEVGECPIWIPESGELCWIDNLGKSIHRFNPATGRDQAWALPSAVGCYGLSADAASAVLALEDGLYHFGFSNAALTKLHDAPYDPVHYRFNDGRVDRQGRFWAGSLRKPESDEPFGRGAFWRMSASGLIRGIEGVSIANGIAWSPDGRTMYIADRPNWQVLAYDYDLDTGDATGRRTFIRVAEGQIPDGATVDVDGNYWIALFKAGRIACYRPDGSLHREIATPVPTPTMVAFGGADMSTMFLTTAQFGLTGKQLDEFPLAGAIFTARVGATGIPEPRLA